MKAYSIAAALRSPEDITELYLSGGHWEAIPPQVFELPNLRVLEISRYGLPSLPAAIGKLRQLERLLLAGNRFSDLPLELEQLGRLRQLDLSGNPLGRLPKLIAGLHHLRELNLSSCSLRRLSPAVGRLQKLQRLNLSGNALRQLPAALFELEELSVLNLNNNRLAEFPALPATCWPVLGQLLLAGNRLTTVPPGIESCRLLQRLDLGSNRLTSCPSAIATLPWLTVLDLGHNQLPELPAALAGCAKLETLDLRHNPLISLPALPPALRRLSLRRCSLTDLPAAVASATSLRSLDLSYNKIESLPASLRQLSNLRELDLRANIIKSLPEVLLLLDRLEALYGHPGTQARSLLSFLRACRRDNTPAGLRLPLFAATKGDELPLRKLSTSMLLRALQFPLRPAALAALAILTGERGRKNEELPLQPGARLAVLGQTTFRKTELERRLPAAGLHYCPQVDPTTTHLVLGLKPSRIPEAGIEQQCVFLPENTLSHYLEKAENRYLASAGIGELHHLQQLLLSRQPANLRLALQLLQGGGVPPALHTELFIAWKTTTDRQLRRALRQVLERHIPEQDKRVLSLPVALNSKLPEAQLRQNIKKLTEGTSFDAGKIRQALLKG